MTNPPEADPSLELIDELRAAWDSDALRAGEILTELQSALRRRQPGQDWARTRGERLQREHLEREKRDLEERERPDDTSSG